jgi:hypothetical protein
MKKQPKVGWMFYLWISWLSLAGILIMAFTLAIHECQRLEAVEQSHWHEIGIRGWFGSRQQPTRRLPGDDRYVRRSSWRRSDR